MNEYYKEYLKLHTDPKCRLMHFLGITATIIYTILSILFESWFGLFFTPLIVYPFAWSGHYFFEKNKPAAFNNPIKAKIADFIMFKDILLGRLTIW